MDMPTIEFKEFDHAQRNSEENGFAIALGDRI